MAALNRGRASPSGGRVILSLLLDMVAKSSFDKRFAPPGQDLLSATVDRLIGRAAVFAESSFHSCSSVGHNPMSTLRDETSIYTQPPSIGDFR